MTRSAVTVALAMLAGWFVVHAEERQGTLRWHRAERRVDADLQGWPLRDTLERIASSTGWEVLMEPGLEGRVSARFERRPEREALASLLADVNFALIPAAKGGSRLLVFRSSTTRATVTVRGRDEVEEAAVARTNVLSNELIVRLKPGSRLSIEELARKLGARVAGSIDSLKAHRLVFDDAEEAAAARASLANEEDVAAVESNYTVGAPARIDPLPGANVPPLSLKARPLQDGSSVIVALLDTGIPTAGVPNADFLMSGISITGSAGVATEGLSHGTAMFETILQGLTMTQGGDAPGQPVRVLPVDIYGGQQETSTFDLALGIVAALERGADILNLSLSGPNPSPLVHDVVQQAAAAGALTFVAPGNQPTTTPTYPAAYPEVVAVTASNQAGQLASYANRGAFVDLIAPGTSVVPYSGEGWIVNGTSVSTAYAAGIAAGLLADSGRSASDISELMRTKMGFQPPAAVAPAPQP